MLTSLAEYSSMRAPAVPQAPESELTPQHAVPHLATRRAACTHITMERMYGSFKCSICNRLPDFGWVYSCTQDHYPSTASESSISTPEAEISDSDRTSGNNVMHWSAGDPRSDSIDFRMPTTQLNPWIEKASDEGHYTFSQIALLRKQKQQVFEIAKAAVERFQESESRKDTAPDTVGSEAIDDSRSHQSGSQPAPTTNAELDLRMFPHCRHRCCQCCRPTYRDRTWQCFEHVFDLDLETGLSDITDQNRPNGTVSLMRTIGLRKSPPRRRPLLRGANSEAIYTTNEAGQIILKPRPQDLAPPSPAERYTPSPDTTASADSSDARTEDSASRGFRQSMKRALKSMLSTRRNNGRARSQQQGTDSSESTSTEVDTAAFDMGLWQELNDELQREAASVPLPDKDSIATDGVNEEVGPADEDRDVESEGQVEGSAVIGVSVTEEAAETGTSDIIMSV